MSDIIFKKKEKNTDRVKTEGFLSTNIYPSPWDTV